MKTFLFREQEIRYYTSWYGKNAFALFFGDGIFIDSEGKNYFIEIEYDILDDNWITKIYWDNDHSTVADYIDWSEYITNDEIEEIKKIATREMKGNENNSSDICE